MLIVNNLELDFDITSPADVLRYKQAGERMEADADALTYPTVHADDPAFLDEYIAMLNGLLQLYGNFLDDVFGDGTADKLLGKKPSMTLVDEVNDALAKAMEDQGRDFGVKLQKYRPNRATRRGNA